MMKALSSSNGTSHSSFPAWLANARSGAYRKAAMLVLNNREATRELARDLSRPHDRRPSNAHHSADYAAITQEVVEHFAVVVGSQPRHERKNRYYQLEAYDRTRVVVTDAECTSNGDDSCGGYLNASWVQERFGRRWWIANQAPLPHTAHAFLSIILQPETHPPEPLQREDGPLVKPCRIRTVVQLTQNIEGGRTKAHPYFPDCVGQSLILNPESSDSALGALKSTLLETRHHEDALCIESLVSVTQTSPSLNGGSDNAPILFRHMLYYAWPDHGVPSPEDQISLVKFIHLVHRLNQSPVSTNENKEADSLDPPIMVGCSAGVGRTGTFIALSSLMRGYGLLHFEGDAPQPTVNGSSNSDSTVTPYRSPLGPIPDRFAQDLVVQEIDWLREQRPMMVQQDQQADLVYDVLTAELLNKHNTTSR
ncbi:hypothetical protein ONZ45_g443 [Pleurotus djamor]|nr:hypothetical protein ONZ45_g443 [Pleurotus djamor]